MPPTLQKERTLTARYQPSGAPSGGLARGRPEFSGWA